MHAMIDFETLNTRPDSHVLTLGLCVFNPFDYGWIGLDPDLQYNKLLEAGFAWRFNQRQNGRSISDDTMNWWEKQTAEAREAAFSDENAKPLKTVLKEFNVAYVENRCCALWSMGPSFDGAILEDMSRREEVSLMVKYNEHRDVRTASEFAELRFRNTRAAHNALSDAVSQAMFVQTCYKKLDLKPKAKAFA